MCSGNPLNRSEPPRHQRVVSRVKYRVSPVSRCNISQRPDPKTNAYTSLPDVKTKASGGSRTIPPFIQSCFASWWAWRRAGSFSDRWRPGETISDCMSGAARIKKPSQAHLSSRPRAALSQATSSLAHSPRDPIRRPSLPQILSLSAPRTHSPSASRSRNGSAARP